MAKTYNIRNMKQLKKVLMELIKKEVKKVGEQAYGDNYRVNIIRKVKE